MKRWVCVGVMAGGIGAFGGAFAQALDEISFPSGRKAAFHDVITSVPDTEGLAARFRFIADIKQNEDWSKEMMSLCEIYALPRVEGMSPRPQQIVISLADQVLPFGESAPDSVQFFEAFLWEADHCMWDVY